MNSLQVTTTDGYDDNGGSSVLKVVRGYFNMVELNSDFPKFPEVMLKPFTEWYIREASVMILERNLAHVVF